MQLSAEMDWSDKTFKSIQHTDEDIQENVISIIKCHIKFLTLFAI